MDNPIPFGLLKWLKDKVEMWVFLKPYQISHSRYLQHANKIRFRNLVDGIEYHLHIESEIFANKANPCSSLVLKFPENYNGGALCGLIVAESGNTQSQQRIHVDYLGKPIVVIELTELLIKKIYSREGGFSLSMESVYLFGQLEKPEGVTLDFRTPQNHLMYDESFNHDYREKWGYVWNLEHLSRLKSDLRHKLLFHTLGDFWAIPRFSDKSVGFSGKLREMYRKFVINRLFSKGMCEFLFWILVIFRVQKV